MKHLSVAKIFGRVGAAKFEAKTGTKAATTASSEAADRLSFHLGSCVLSSEDGITWKTSCRALIAGILKSSIEIINRADYRLECKASEVTGSEADIDAP